MRIPPAEIDITEDTVRALIRAQHPDLLDDLQLMAHGWDNVVFRLGTDLTVRLPRRAAAAELLRNEQRWLPVLGPRLNLPIPVPIRVGTPTEGFPWHWSISPWFTGHPLAHVPVTNRRGYARTLASFFAGLHRPAPEDAPTSPVRGTPLERRSALLAQHLDLGVADRPERLHALWEQLVATPPWPRPLAWVHGDPHPANVLVSQGRVSAVIDFGDLTAGDPATDLALGWLVFDRAGRQRFEDQYAEDRSLDQHTRARARGWALSLGLSLLANSDDDPVLEAVGRHALDQVLRG